MIDYKYCIIVARIRNPSRGKLVAGVSRAVEGSGQKKIVL